MHSSNSRTRLTLAVSALAVASLIVASVVAGAVGPSLRSANAGRYTGALVNQSSRSLYVLSVEKGATIKCGGSCLSSWIPLEVARSAKSVALGVGVRGAIGFVTRSATEKQVTFNSFPLYTFVGDRGAHQSHGEGIAAFGGKWTLVKASSTSASATPYATLRSAPSAPTTTTTTPPSTTTTTTTTPSGGGAAY